jgi:hypothetical protein
VGGVRGARRATLASGVNGPSASFPIERRVTPVGGLAAACAAPVRAALRRRHAGSGPAGTRRHATTRYAPRSGARDSRLPCRPARIGPVLFDPVPHVARHGRPPTHAPGWDPRGRPPFSGGPGGGVRASATARQSRERQCCEPGRRKLEQTSETARPDRRTGAWAWPGVPAGGAGSPATCQCSPMLHKERLWPQGKR